MGLDMYCGRRSSNPGSPTSMSSRPWVSKSMVQSAAGMGGAFARAIRGPMSRRFFTGLAVRTTGLTPVGALGSDSGARGTKSFRARASIFSSPVTAKLVVVGTAMVTGGRSRLVTTDVDGPETTTQALLEVATALVVVVKENGQTVPNPRGVFLF